VSLLVWKIDRDARACAAIGGVRQVALCPIEILPLLQSIMIAARSATLIAGRRIPRCPIEACPQLVQYIRVKISSTSPIARCDIIFPSVETIPRSCRDAAMHTKPRYTSSRPLRGRTLRPATVIVEVIVGVCDFFRHLDCSRVIDCSVRSNELTQTSRRFSTGESIIARPLYSIAQPRVLVTGRFRWQRRRIVAPIP